MKDQAFANAVWSALKGDHSDLRKQAMILEAHRASLLTAETEAGVIDAILRAMNAASMTQRELAKALGVTEPRVSQMLREGSNMTLRTMQKVFAAIRLRIPEIKA